MKTPYGEASDTAVTQYAIKNAAGDTYMGCAWDTPELAQAELDRINSESRRLKYVGYSVKSIKSYALKKPYQPDWDKIKVSKSESKHGANW